jgi:hypothetical protein
MPQRNRDDAPDDGRRDFLVKALSVGALAGGLGWNRAALADLFGKLPGRLREGQSIFEMKGDVLVNGKSADRSTIIGPSDKITTGANSYLIAAVGSNAFIVRDNSALELSGGARAVKSVFRLITGKFLGVFGKLSGNETLSVTTPVATVGIRGTGLYAESDAEKTYLCTCYGSTQLASVADPKATEQVVSQHHDAPRYILAQPDGGKRIIPAPFINHTDLELMTLEALVGRKVPFGLPDQNYERPRRDY